MSGSVNVEGVAWTVTYWTGTATPAFFAAGHYGMMLADVSTARWSERRGARGVGFFALGHALCQPVFASFSQDFARISSEFGFDTAVFFWVVLAGSTSSAVNVSAAKLLEKRERLLRQGKRRGAAGRTSAVNSATERRARHGREDGALDRIAVP